MQYRRMGRTDLDVSVVGVGTWQYGGEWGKDFTVGEVGAILGRARDLGINLIDTAECYGDHLSESLIGQALPGRREDWVIATKFGHRYTGPHERRAEWSPGEVVAQLERSLTALRTDYVDLYQFHSGIDRFFDDGELWSALSAQVAAGKIRHLGISLGRNTNAYQVGRALALDASVIQLVYSRIDTEPEPEVLPLCARDDLGVLAREALAGGLLSGKYSPGTRFTDPADTRSRRDALVLESRLRQADAVKSEVPDGVPMAAWALAWVLGHPAVTAVIPGAKTVAQIESAAAAADLVVER